jgi:aminopeptidase N
MFRYSTLLVLSLLALHVTGQFNCQDVKSAALVHGAHGPIISIDNRAKSDTIDILHYDLHLDFTEITQQKIKGHCDITFRPKVNNVTGISLDLLELNIDSITHNGSVLSYTYNDTIIRATFAGILNTADTSIIKVHYHGTPIDDGSGFGGWHQSGGYYYNLGVGFAANPHTFGRAWFPCFDNFVEKTTYDFHFTTVKPLRPYANGIRMAETALNGDTILTDWTMTDPIPTYLASVAISNYAEITDNVTGANGSTPIMLMAKPSDSLKMVNSFVNLKQTFGALENAFGPYYWQKVGYCATPRGAMEHATSIHLPTSLVNGTLSGEDIIAHELAHHWWGNLVTCETDADMWINEGMAEYSSHLYTETVYGTEHYLDIVQDNAHTVLETAHINDDGFKAIQGLTHEYVYGTHVYQKGAMVGHNLRAYLGDSLFFTGLTTLLQNNMYGNITSAQFRDQLSQITGVSLTDFFDDWVYNPGFPQFSVDSLHNSTGSTAIKISQRIRKAPALFSNIPVFVTFFSPAGDTVSRKVVMNGPKATASFQNLPFTPAYAIASYNGKLLSGNTYDEHKINKTGTYNAVMGKMKITANTLNDSARLIVMHHWAGPGGKIPAGKDYRLSPQHYWTIQGTDLSNADMTGNITVRRGLYNLDEELISANSDSLVVLYREDATKEWTLYPHQVKTRLGSITLMDINQLKAGDYVLANTAEKVGLQEMEGDKGSIEIFPNPAGSEIKIRFNESGEKHYDIRMVDASGKELYRKTTSMRAVENELTLDVSEIKSSYVIVSVNGNGQKIVLKP